MSRLNGKNYCNSQALCPCRIKFCHASEWCTFISLSYLVMCLRTLISVMHFGANFVVSSDSTLLSLASSTAAGKCIEQNICPQGSFGRSCQPTKYPVLTSKVHFKRKSFFPIEEICFYANVKNFFRMKSASCQFLIVVLCFATFRSVLAVLGIALDTQTSSQAQTSQAQTSQGQTGDISNSEKEGVTEKSKEESSVAS